MSQNQNSPNNKSNSKNKTIDKSRRRFTKLGVAAPVIATVAGRPAWGSQCSPSAVLSHTHASHHPDAPTNCALGCSPGFWKQCKPDWSKLTEYSRSDSFCDVFFDGDRDLCPFPDKSLGEVINGETESCKSDLYNRHTGTTGHTSSRHGTTSGYSSNFESVWGNINIASVHAIAAMLNASAHEYDAIGGNLGYLNKMPQDFIDAYYNAYNEYASKRDETCSVLIQFKDIVDQYGEQGINEVTCVFNAHGEVSPYNYWVNQSLSFKYD